MDNWLDGPNLKYFQESILFFSLLLPQAMFIISQKKTKVIQPPPRELSIINQVRPLGKQRIQVKRNL